MTSDAAVKPVTGVRNLAFTDLPRELQKEVFSHCSQADHICLSLVNRHFRDLSSAELYRSFNIVFPDEDDPAYDSPVDGLAGGLDTFVTSDYDYAKHLRELSLDTLSAGSKAETAYKPYLYSVSCGKFMNTLLLLTIRKATALDTFKWNIRVELSRPVYKALHSIDTLRHVQIRLQAGPSTYERPPPLPFTAPHASNNAHDLSSPPGFALPLPPPPFYMPPSLLPKPQTRTKPPKKLAIAQEPPTLSGFKQLRSLAVLDIDDLNMVTELKSAVRASATTLTKLKLSFSDTLSMQARKPPPDADPDDSDPDDEFQVVPVVSGPNYEELSAPARAFRAQQERKEQESVLGRILDVEPYLVKKPSRRPREKEVKAAKEGPSPNPGQDFIDTLKAVSTKLLNNLNASTDLNSTQQDILDTIENAARKYVAAEEAKAKVEEKEEKKGEPKDGKKEEEKLAKDEEKGESSTAASNGLAVTEEVCEDSKESKSTMFEPKAKEADKGANPEDIDIEEPVEVLGDDSQDVSTSQSQVLPESSLSQPHHQVNGQVNGITADTYPLGPSAAKVVANLNAQRLNFRTLSEKLEFFEIQVEELSKKIQQLDIPGVGSASALEGVEEAEEQMRIFSSKIKDIQYEMSIVANEIGHAEMPAAQIAQMEAQEDRIGEYIRATRGMALESLSIHLMPVKASVLSRGIDICALKRITLLNVGPQAPIWSLFARENKLQPIALRNIYTDNISLAFLTFVSQLEALHELFILERPDKYKPESFAPKSNVKMEQIRRLVLRKHMPTLKRLMIKNQQDLQWDVDEKTMMLICKRAKVLEELAVSMGIRAIHIMLQNISGLAVLRALHIVHLRNDDTCVWVLRETKRFMVDTLSHFPALKLEWIAIDDDERVERIIRYTEPPKKKEKSINKDKGKGKAVGPVAGAVVSDQFPILPLEGWEPGSSESDAEDEDTFACKIETVDNIHFYDVYEVRIFKKDIISGRL